MSRSPRVYENGGKSSHSSKDRVSYTTQLLADAESLMSEINNLLPEDEQKRLKEMAVHDDVGYMELIQDAAQSIRRERKSEKATTPDVAFMKTNEYVAEHTSPRNSQAREVEEIDANSMYEESHSHEVGEPMRRGSYLSQYKNRGAPHPKDPLGSPVSVDRHHHKASSHHSHVPRLPLSSQRSVSAGASSPRKRHSPRVSSAEKQRLEYLVKKLSVELYKSRELPQRAQRYACMACGYILHQHGVVHELEEELATSKSEARSLKRELEECRAIVERLRREQNTRIETKNETFLEKLGPALAQLRGEREENVKLRTQLAEQAAEMAKMADMIRELSEVARQSSGMRSK